VLINDTSAGSQPTTEIYQAAIDYRNQGLTVFPVDIQKGPWSIGARGSRRNPRRLRKSGVAQPASALRWDQPRAA
jgi:hypothetical protein